ncbi:MAG: hypothetical protein IKS67_11220, partial [Victivallales bacterium]|nr:hypothetical protein [Victivallales bacterium]
LKSVIDNIMGKLILCQYKGPFMQYNPYLTSLKNVVPEAYGGITAAPNSPFVRIDNVQHQVHATLLMLKYLYPETNSPNHPPCDSPSSSLYSMKSPRSSMSSTPSATAA